MPLTIEDPETVAALRRLATESERTVEEVLREAVAAAERLRPAKSAAKRTGMVSPEERSRRLAAIRELQDEVASWPKTGVKADKAFFDSLED